MPNGVQTLRSRRRVWPWLMVVLMMSAALAWLSSWQRRGDVVAYWQQSLNTVSDAEALELLDQMASRGDEGVKILAIALGMDRPEVPRRAAMLLRSQLDEWESLTPRAATPKLVQLADALADHVQTYHAEARNAAAELVTRILLWPLDIERADLPRLNTACHRVLSVANDTDEVGTSAGDSTPLAASLQFPPLRRAPIGDFDAALPPALPVPGATNVAGNEPARLPSAVASDARQMTAGAATESVGAASNAAATASTSAATAAPAVATSDVRDLKVVELCAYLHDPTTPQARAARSELITRGLSVRQIDLGSKLTDPDPRVRCQHAELLPSLNDVDAKPWLLWLSKDTDAQVRLTAMTLMATSRDPEMLGRVFEMSRTDDDPRVREQAERALGQK